MIGSVKVAVMYDMGKHHGHTPQDSWSIDAWFL